jgi:hypothetical protein
VSVGTSVECRETSGECQARSGKDGFQVSGVQVSDLRFRISSFGFQIFVPDGSAATRAISNRRADRQARCAKPIL